MKAAFAKYCEARAASGDVTPEAYFTHTLGDVKWKSDDETVRRWMELALDAMSDLEPA